MKTPMKRADIGKPITPNERRRLAARIKKREEQRKRQRNHTVDRLPPSPQ
jgi:hypothetical protein